MIALLGYYGFGNLGDELLLQACIKKFGREVIVLSNDPEQTSRDFGVRAVNRWNYREVVKALRECESLCLGGGGLFQDVTSIKSCLWYWLIVRLAKFLGVEVFALGQSIGPLNSRIGRVFTAQALKACRSLEVRDDNSYNLAKELGCKNIIKGRDLVFSLAASVEQACQPWLTRQTVLTHQTGLINLRPCRDLDNFVKILVPHVADIQGEKIGVALSSDDEKILQTLQKKLSLSKILLVKNFSQAESLWSKASYAVGMRLHFGVLSVIFQTPVTLMPYDVKVSEFARENNIAVIKFEHE